MSQVYFKDIEQMLSSTLTSAKSRIYIAVAWFTNDGLFKELKNALRRTVEVKILITDDILNRSEFGLDFGILVNEGADVRFSRPDRGTMHNKFCIIDDKVITGSYNWTYQANTNNENVVIIEESAIVDKYYEQFEMLFGDGIPIKLPYEHLKWINVKEGDFSELRRNIFKDISAKNDENKVLKQNKLIKLNDAYKSGNPEYLANANSLPTTYKYKTITEVLTNRSQDFVFRLWKENHLGYPQDNTYGYHRLMKWIFLPHEIRFNKDQREYISGKLFPYDDIEDIPFHGHYPLLDVYDKDFISTIKVFVGDRKTLFSIYKEIPEYLICIEHAKMFFYKFPQPLFNKNQPKLFPNNTTRFIPGINLFGIVKIVDGENEEFYDGWDPQKRGEKIAKAFFVNSL